MRLKDDFVLHRLWNKRGRFALESTEDLLRQNLLRASRTKSLTVNSPPFNKAMLDSHIIPRFHCTKAIAASLQCKVNPTSPITRAFL